jgi:hypothetical protein
LFSATADRSPSPLVLLDIDSANTVEHPLDAASEDLLPL